MFAHVVALRIVVVCILLQVLLGFVCVTGSLAAFVCLGRCVCHVLTVVADWKLIFACIWRLER